MSIWTHVSGDIRVDDWSFVGDKRNTIKDIKKLLGPVSTFEKPNRRCKLPIGSEGSLEYQIWENPSESDLARFNISIWGDLRSFDSKDVVKIEQWFKNLYLEFESDKVMLPWRDAVLKIETEFDGISEILYLDSKKERIDKVVLRKGK